MCLLEIGFQFDRATKGGNRSSSVAPSLQLAAQIELRIGIVRTQLHCDSKLIERALVAQVIGPQPELAVLLGHAGQL